MREKIKLVSSAGTGHFYTTDKNKSSTPDKIEIKKFDPNPGSSPFRTIVLYIYNYEKSSNPFIHTTFGSFSSLI